MAFTSLTSAEISAGEPTKQELFTKTKDNFDDHESRITSLETVTVLVSPIVFDVRGEGFDKDAVTYHRIENAVTATGFVLFMKEAGTAGTVEVDVQKKRGAGSFASILSSTVSVAFGSGDFATAAGGLADTDFQVGDILRLDVKGIQTDSTGFEVIISVEGA